MSINHFVDKIKGSAGIDSTTLLCLLVIILVAFSSFGLGKLSVQKEANNNEIILENTNTNIVKGEIGKSVEAENGLNNANYKSEERMYVASKNGKLYYTPNCSGAKRIASKNEIWFATSIEAEKAGYTLSTSCK